MIFETGLVGSMFTVKNIVDVDAELNLSEVQSLCMQLPRFSMDDLDLRDWLIKIVSNGRLVVAFEGDELVGMIGFYANDDETQKAYLTVIVVAEKCRGAGLGDRLFNVLITDARDAGMKYCELNVVKTNARAISFYERRGLTVIGPGYDEWHYRMSGLIV